MYQDPERAGGRANAVVKPRNNDELESLRLQNRKLKRMVGGLSIALVLALGGLVTMMVLYLVRTDRGSAAPPEQSSLVPCVPTPPPSKATVVYYFDDQETPNEDTDPEVVVISAEDLYGDIPDGTVADDEFTVFINEDPLP